MTRVDHKPVAARGKSQARRGTANGAQGHTSKALP